MSPPVAGCGRFAPSPTGHFHLGNLRTALIAWLCARSQGQSFLLRIEDLDPDRSKPHFETSQLADLTALGIDWDAEPARQSQRHSHYRLALDQLVAGDLAYRCFCSRRDIAAAAKAPHEETGEQIYPGTCSGLSPSVARNRADSGEPHSWRIRAEGAVVPFGDLRHGHSAAPVDDFILVRRDGVASYHLAVVVDDAAQGVTEVVRGDDLLLPTTARHAFLYDALGFERPDWRHVPLVLEPDGTRMAKRIGSNTRRGYLDEGHTDTTLIRCLARSLDLESAESAVAAADLLTDFRPGAIPPDPVTLDLAQSREASRSSQ